MLHLTREQLQDIDRRSTAEYGIPSIVLMENAARGVVEQVYHMLSGECCGKVLILCGGGNNGGDGLAVARHLHNLGAEVIIGLLADPAGYKGDALINWKIVSAMKLPAKTFEQAMLNDPPPMLIVDAVFGTGLTKPPREPFGTMVAAVEACGIPVLAIDVPSGLDCDTGTAPGACIRATRTVTFVAEKVGFTNPSAMHYLGEVIVADIGCPRELFEQDGICQ